MEFVILLGALAVLALIVLAVYAVIKGGVKAGVEAANRDQPPKP